MCRPPIRLRGGPRPLSDVISNKPSPRTRRGPYRRGAVKENAMSDHHPTALHTSNGHAELEQEELVLALTPVQLALVVGLVAGLLLVWLWRRHA